MRTTTINEPEKAKIIEKLTTSLYISAECCEAEEGGISYVNKEGITKLQHGGLLFPFNTIPQNYPGNYKTPSYKYYDYTEHETNAATFGRSRSSDRIHAARDLYSDVNESVYAITDGVVVSVENFYMQTDVIAIEHEYETSKAKGHKMVIRYGEVDKNTIKVKVGDKVFRGDKIAEVGQLIRKDGTNFQQPSGENRGMLHIEFYTGQEKGKTFKPGWVKNDEMLHSVSDGFSSGRSFQRRRDLFDGLDLLDEMLETSKVENRIE